MAKVILPGGIQIDGLTPKEAAEAAREFLSVKSEPVQRTQHRQAPRPQRRVRPVVTAPAPRRSSDNGFDIGVATVEFLEAIKSAGANGLPAESIQSILHADSPKGIGGRMVRMNGHLRRLGFHTTDNLFDNPKNRKTGKRTWKPKSQIDDAIEAARKAVHR